MPKHLTYEMIDHSPEIQNWISQYSESDCGLVANFLHRLEFVDHDEFAEWFNSSISKITFPRYTAIYAVRKIPEGDGRYFNENGLASKRPAGSQGSEDTLSGLISQITKKRKDILDHPDLEVLKSQSVKEILLVDDSIGSGSRISGFVNSMLSNKTMMSWWSYGLIRFHILSFMRVYESRGSIITTIRGTDHHKRKIKKSEKIIFHDHLTPHTTSIKDLWGDRYDALLYLLKSSKVRYPQGYKNAFSNLVFFHSVPNTLPGILWQNSKKNKPIFPWERHFPDWLSQLFNRKVLPQIEPIHLKMLRLIKKGVRGREALSRSLGRPIDYVSQLIENLIDFGLLTESTRLTDAGYTELKKHRTQKTIDYNYNLYIPKSWCAGQAPIQPLPSEDLQEISGEVDSTLFSLEDLVDGEFGQDSLGKTDAKTAAPSFTVMPQLPSESRMSHDSNGQEGQKEA